MLSGVESAQPSQDMHHIIPIRIDPSLRMISSNWLAVCRYHHEELEKSELEGLKTKRWSLDHYHERMGG